MRIKLLTNIVSLGIALCFLFGTSLAQAISPDEAKEAGTKLFQELESFKDSPVFKKHGFNKAKGNPAPEWLLKVHKLKDESTGVGMDLGFAIMFLEDLGKAYAAGNVQEITTYRKAIISEFGGNESQQVKPAELVGHPLAVRILDYKKYERKGRTRLDVTIIPAQDQSKATQADLAATAVGVATTAQKETDAHIVTVTMNCQQAANTFGELQLAYVVYVPDGLGMTGKTPGKIWEFLDAAPRGFTQQELKYLQLWSEMRDQFKNQTGDVDSEKLKAAIAKKMKIKPGSLTPHLNTREPVEGKLHIEGDLKIVQ